MKPNTQTHTSHKNEVLVGIEAQEEVFETENELTPAKEHLERGQSLDVPLILQKCVPCHGGILPLAGPELRRLQAQLNNWSVWEDHHLLKTFKFSDFASALAFVNKVGEIAEGQGHHPNIFLSWGMVKIELWTHAIEGLSLNDFILAAKIDQIK